MPVRPLPADPSLENLKNQAKKLLRALQSGNTETLALVREFHPHAETALAQFTLADAQLTLARSYEFASWAKLKHHIAQVIDPYRFDPPTFAEAESGAQEDSFVRLGCLNYGSWNLNWAAEARQMLARKPEISRANLYAAATAGNVTAVRELLQRNPSLLNSKGGPLGWEPLLYCCYSRVDSTHSQHSTLEVARFLLQRGADPNAGFLWRGLVPPNTALTGAFGEGEAGAHNPPHLYREELVRLLLESGADPNDGQALYNTGAPIEVLELLFSYGLGRENGGPWFRRIGLRFTARQILDWELWRAVHENNLAKTKILVEHGAAVSPPAREGRRTPYQEAIFGGNQEIADYLLRNGAVQFDLEPKQRFASACVGGLREKALAILRDNPGLLNELGPEGRAEVVHRAARSGRENAVRLVAEIGFDLNAMVMNRTALHDAAWNGNVEMIRLLIELGADPRIREPEYHGSPLGWAEYNHQPAAIQSLLPHADIFDAVQQGCIKRTKALLDEDVALARIVDEQGCPLIFWLKGSTKCLDDMLTLLLSHHADINVRVNGSTLLDRALKRGDEEFSLALRRHGARIAEELN